MTIYIANVDKREDESEILSIHKTKQGAVRSIEETVIKRYNWEAGRVDSLLHAYGGNLDDGKFNSEDESYYIIEKELND